MYSVGDEFVILLNEDGLPHLQLSSMLRDGVPSCNEKEKDYVSEKVRSASWLIRSLYQRQRTLYKVVESIVKHQQPFFRDGVTKLAPLILKALELPGFAEDAPGKEVTVGFGRKTLLDAAPAVLDAVKSGAVRHIFLVGGCDGAKPGRNYYTEFVEKTPQDTLILTLACGKFPRLLDVGQCNDAYSAVKVALALADALKCGVNDLPLSLVLSWYEQKAVAILLTLLALGVKNIHLGPSLPAFVSPDILNLLVENWGIKPISTPDEDLKALLG